GLLYANTLHQFSRYKHLEHKPYEVGQRYQNIENVRPPPTPGQPQGHIDAIDPLTGDKKWRGRAPPPPWDAGIPAFARGPPCSGTPTPAGNVPPAPGKTTPRHVPTPPALHTPPP